MAELLVAGIAIGALAGVVLAVNAGLAFAVMSLWNWLGPDLFQAGTITFWQALGVLILLSIVGSVVRKS
jgi:hypothetical protein